MSIDLPLGKQVPFPRAYSPEVLVGIPRAADRKSLELGSELPFDGLDVWNAYELSWLGPKGKPVVAIGQLRVPAASPNLVESKSLKLYFNSLNATRCGSVSDVRDRIAGDVEQVVGAPIDVRLTLIGDADIGSIGTPPGECLDELDVPCDVYSVDPGLLSNTAQGAPEVEETLYSRLLKSNCPITGQPDWATLLIRYRGPRIDREALLRYIVSYRDHDGFHEHCVERIFMDLRRHCGPSALTVFARYTRRGGIDICPFRSDFEALAECTRLIRQ